MTGSRTSDLASLALAAARQADLEIKAGKYRGPLHGTSRDLHVLELVRSDPKRISARGQFVDGASISATHKT
jgi:hypothetical protein